VGGRGEEQQGVAAAGEHIGETAPLGILSLLSRAEIHAVVGLANDDHVTNLVTTLFTSVRNEADRVQSV
jgi:hypothetical protein